MKSEKTTALERTICQDYGNIAGIHVLKYGQTVYEGYFGGCTAASPVHVYSVTKSILSILIGIAIGQGAIQSVSQKVLDFFPDYTVKRGEKAIQQITLEHLLTMTAPYKYRSAPYTKYFTSESWVRSALDLLGGKGTIGEFRYTPLIGPDILSGILTHATGKPVLDFAKEALFSPLGITVGENIIFHSKEEQFEFIKAKHVSGWVADPMGINTAGWGLALTAPDMAKIGQLYLNGGTWKGKQIVHAQWVSESTREHTRWKELDLPYGYLWWIGEDGYAAMGDGGNIIYVNTGKQLVVSVASYFKPTAKDRIELIKTRLEPLFA